MADVFISYKRDERAAVERIAGLLRDLRLSVWFDAGMSAGETFSDEIDREARNAKAILICWSPAARESRWVKAEAMIGFEQDKLAACYVAGPDGFSPPTPFNASHAEDLRAWLAAPSETHAGWRSVLRRLGKLCGRADIESWGALDPQAPAHELRAWIEAHETSPLFMTVDTLLRNREAADAERAQREQAARERRAREEAERREREAAARARAEAEQARQDAERRQREAERAADSERVRRDSGRFAGWILGAVALIALMIWSPWNDRAAPRMPRIEMTPSEIASQPSDATSVSDGAPFRDCSECPEMVRIPGGTYTQGSPAGEGGGSNERPQRSVSVRAFALSRTEVTRGEWAAFVRATNRPDPQVTGDTYCTWRSPGFAQEDTHPVVCVNHADALAYVAWLNERTQNRFGFRLPSEAEWEYAARGGDRAGPYWWGSTASHEYANYGADSCCSGLASGRDRWVNTAPVGQFPANPFGLHDMHGNVWEWVQDCYADSYPASTANGSAYEPSSCSNRVYRGGGWNLVPQDLRSAYRSGVAPSYRGSLLGFRVARTL